MEEVKAKKEEQARKLKEEEDRLEEKLKREREQLDEAYRKEEESKRKKVEDARNANQVLIQERKGTEAATEENFVVSKKPRGGRE